MKIKEQPVEQEQKKINFLKKIPLSFGLFSIIPHSYLIVLRYIRMKSENLKPAPVLSMFRHKAQIIKIFN